MQNLRARAYDPANGRFIGLDPFAGNMQDPQSLHKYAYVHGDPIQGIDPTGWAFIDDLSLQGIVSHAAFSLLVNIVRPHAETNLTLGTIFPGLGGTVYGLLKPDVVDTRSKEYFELKPVRHKNRSDLQAIDAAQMIGYDLVLGVGFGFRRGDSRALLGQIPIGGLLPIVITVGANVYALKFWAADDPMSGGFRGDGLIWYSLDELYAKPRPIKQPDVEVERVFGPERVRIEVWHPTYVPILQMDLEVASLTKAAVVGVTGGIFTYLAIATVLSIPGFSFR